MPSLAVRPARAAAWAFAALLAVGTGLYSYRFAWIDPEAVAPGIREVLLARPWGLIAHALFAATALIVGPFQFVAAIRVRAPRVHRVLGRVYVAACVGGGLSAFALVPIASGGIVATIGFGLLAVIWTATTLGAFAAALRRDFALHRRMMIYSFALTFAAVTLRLQIPFGIVFLGFKDYSSMSPILSFSAWVPNLLVAWWWLRRAPAVAPLPA